MVKSDLWHEIYSRFKLKETKKAIARTLGLSILTLRKVLRQAAHKKVGKAVEAYGCHRLAGPAVPGPILPLPPSHKKRSDTCELNPKSTRVRGPSAAPDPHEPRPRI